MDTKEQAILLLAAGGSRRMGQPKQLLQYQNEPVISHLVRLLCAQGRPVYVVLGAVHSQVSAVLTKFPVEIIINEEWTAGMGTSLRAGLAAMLAKEEKLRQVCCCVVDQVFLSQRVLDRFWKLAAHHDLIAARYASGEIGVPALFGATYFADLLDLENQQGAKPLLRRFADRVETVAFPQGDFDLDYPADWELFLKKRRE